MCVSEAERTGIASPLGSAVRLRYSELNQAIAELTVRVVGRAMLGAVELDGMRTCGRSRRRSRRARRRSGTT